MDDDRDLFVGLLVLENVEVTDTKLGSGAYGNVLEVKVGESLCAAKEIHQQLLDDQDPGVPVFKRKYADECRTISQLQHPRIVQFLGIYFKPGSELPLMVMELLFTSLGRLLSSASDINLSVKLSTLHDVCTGLEYLHGRREPIIHRDLTANNVLLDSSLRAKIADMGNSRMVDPRRLPQTLTLAPGTQNYMPPEALDPKNHRYGPSLDIFSFGHLSLYTLTQVCPEHLLPASFINEKTEKIEARSQVECRQDYIDDLERLFRKNHEDLVQIVKDCLKDSPKRRPTCGDLLVRLNQARHEDLLQECLIPVSVGKIRMELQLNKKDKEMEAVKRSSEKAIKKLEQTKEELEKKLEMEQKKLEQCQKKLEKSENEMKSKQSAVAKVVHIQHEVSLQEPLSIEWDTSRPDLPFAITDYIQSVIIAGLMYVGGGWTRKRSDNNYNILTFDLTKKVWHQLPAAYSARDFAMVAIEEQLVLVGGCDRSNTDTNKLGRYDMDNWEWTRPYTAMPTARHNSSAAYYDGFLVVAGGVNRSLLSTVEILDVPQNQWHSASEVPVRCHSMKSTVVNKVWYLMGGYEMKAAIGGYEKKASNKVYCVSLPDLCSTFAAATSDASSDTAWKEIPGTGCMFSSPVNMNGSLYAVGGKCVEVAISTLSNYGYSAGWQIAGKLHSPVYNCTCSFFNGVLYMAGGHDMSSKVAIGSIKS